MAEKKHPPGGLRYGVDVNRHAANAMRRRFLVALGHAIHVTWPVMSVILGIQLTLGVLTGFVEGWSVADALTGLVAAIVVHAMRSTLTDSGNDDR